MKRSILFAMALSLAMVFTGSVQAKSRKHSRHHQGGHGHHTQSSSGSRSHGKSYGGVR